MAKTVVKSSGENYFFTQSEGRANFLDRLLGQSLRLILIPFVVILLVNIETVARVSGLENNINLSAMYDPVYQTFLITLILTAWLIKSFPKHVQQTFWRLHQREVITEKEKGSLEAFSQSRQRWQKHPARYVLPILFVSLGMAYNYAIIFAKDLERLFPSGQPSSVLDFEFEFWFSNVLLSISILINMFLVGLWIFELVVTAVRIHRLSHFFDLDIQPTHPDRCGGFEIIGDLCLRMVFILLIPTLFVVFWLAASTNIVSLSDLDAFIPEYVRNPDFSKPVYYSLILLFLSGITVFFWPMYMIHRYMLEAQAELDRKLDNISRQIQDLTHDLLADPVKMPADERKKTMLDIDSLKNLYAYTRNVPTWPFERKMLIKFISSQTIPIISLVGLGSGPLGRLLNIVVGLFQSE